MSDNAAVLASMQQEIARLRDEVEKLKAVVPQMEGVCLGPQLLGSMRCTSRSQCALNCRIVGASPS